MGSGQWLVLGRVLGAHRLSRSANGLEGRLRLRIRSPGYRFPPLELLASVVSSPIMGNRRSRLPVFIDCYCSSPTKLAQRFASSRSSFQPYYVSIFGNGVFFDEGKEFYMLLPGDPTLPLDPLGGHWAGARRWWPSGEQFGVGCASSRTTLASLMALNTAQGTLGLKGAPFFEEPRRRGRPRPKT